MERQMDSHLHMDSPAILLGIHYGTTDGLTPVYGLLCNTGRFIMERQMDSHPHMDSSAILLAIHYGTTDGLTPVYGLLCNTERFIMGRHSYVSVERRAESGERRFGERRA